MARKPKEDNKKTILDSDVINHIFRLLHRKTGIDFSDYKPTTMNRRIQRRMMLYGISGLDKYLIFLQKNPEEIKKLQSDLLIKVTRFFRDPEKFNALNKLVFPVITNQSKKETIRIWVPGCATGEEAYSIAILLSEFLEKKKSKVSIQIFATDVNNAVIEKARTGFYPDSIEDHVSPNRLFKFFIKVENGYQVNKDLREKCVFAVHDLTQNPPFSNLDLISCLNVLIYLKPRLQKKILGLFHYALKPNGFLMLGNSESIGMEKKLFHSVESRNKIYSKETVDSSISLQDLVNSDQKKIKSNLPSSKKVSTKTSSSAQPESEQVSRLEKVVRLKDTLELTREYTDSIVDELNIMAEDLESTNEELLVNNEELQTANEELETSQEELQAANEELLSLNLELQKREEALARLAAIVESSDDAIISKTKTGIITTWNKGAQRLYGYQASEIIGKPITVLMPPGVKDDFPRIMKLLLQGKRVEHYETQRMTKDGRILEVSLTISSLRDAKGKIIGASKIARDITDRKQTEKNLSFLAEASKILSSSLDYNTTLQSITKLAVPHFADWCSVDMLNSEGKIELVSIAHKDPEKVKWARELRQTNPLDLTVTSGIAKVLRTGKAELYPEITHAMLAASANSENQLKLMQDLGFTSAMIVPIIINRKSAGVITFVSAELKRHFNQQDLVIVKELAGRVSLAVEHARLYEDAQQAITLRDDFISIASHELKTPVTSLKMYTQGIQKQFETRDKNTLIDYFVKLDHQVDKLAVLITDLLNVSKMQLGKLELSEGSFNLNKQIKETVENLQQTTKKHSINIKGNVTKNVWGDKDKIGQVLTNLLSNAIKYSPQSDKIVVNLKTDQNFAVVSVQDFGIGMEQKYLQKIFDRFYRVGDPNEKTFPGLGIGLYISNEIIRRHGGTMSVVSKKGQGSKFSFTLPYAK